LVSGQAKLGTDDSTFNMILVSRSLPQLRQIFTDYERMFNTKFETVVKNEFSGSLEQALLAIGEKDFFFFIICLMYQMIVSRPEYYSCNFFFTKIQKNEKLEVYTV
jgi:hypothetical protein